MEINEVSDMLKPGIGRKCTKNIMNRRLLCHLDLVVLEKKREVYNSYINITVVVTITTLINGMVFVRNCSLLFNNMSLNTRG